MKHCQAFIPVLFVLQIGAGCQKFTPKLSVRQPLCDVSNSSWQMLARPMS